MVEALRWLRSATSCDADKYWEANAWAGYSVLRQGQLYLGVRRIEAGFEDSADVSFDTGFHVGLRLDF
jgi:hypothetical protein